MNTCSYLLFNGQCEEAFGFYQKTLGGEIKAMLSHEGTPMEESTPIEWRKKIMHACLELSPNNFLMASDVPPTDYKDSQGFSVQLSVDTPAEAERVFEGLAERGSIQMPLQETFWAARFGMLTDRYGVPWMVNCSLTPCAE
jgi:PhnB protein